MADIVISRPDGLPAEPDPGDRVDRPRGQWRALLVRMHFYAGVLVAPFIFLACLTGAVYVFNPQLDRLMEPGLLVVDHPGRTALPLNEQVARARAAEPDLNLVSVQPNTRPDETTRVNFNRPGAEPMTYHTAFVNPYTGEVQGSKDISSMGGAMPFSTWMARFHGDMGLGEFGRWYSEMASLWIVVVTLGGIVVWWQRSAVHRKPTSAAFWKRFAVVDRGRRPGVRRTMSWHSVIGVWTAVFALLFGLTGLPFARTTGPKWVAQTGNMHRSSVTLDTSLPDAAGSPASTGVGGSGGAGVSPTAAPQGAGGSSDMPGMDMSGMDMSGMDMSGAQAPTGHPTGAAAGSTGTSGDGSSTGDAPAANPPAGTSAGMSHGNQGPDGGSGSGGMRHMTNPGVPPAVAARMDYDAMVAAARTAGVTERIRITSPSRPGTGWTVEERRQSWPLAYDSVLIDPRTNQVLRSLDWEKATPAVDKLNRYIMVFHFGRLFGLTGQILFGLSMIAIMWVTWWGYKMWWQRRPRGTAWRLGKVPVRGTWRKAPRTSLVIWSVVTLALFWIFPVLALSALGFLAFDAGLGWITSRRNRTPAPTTV